MENFRYIRSKSFDAPIRGVEYNIHHYYRTDPGYFLLSWRPDGDTYRVPVPQLVWLFHEYGYKIPKSKDPVIVLLYLKSLLGFEGEPEDGDFSNCRTFFPAFPNQGTDGHFCTGIEAVHIPHDLDGAARQQAVHEACLKYATAWMGEPFNKDYDDWRCGGLSPWGSRTSLDALVTWEQTPLEEICRPGFYPYETVLG